MASEIGVAQSASVAADAELFVAVDTGGTKTCACLVDFNQPAGKRVLGRGRTEDRRTERCGVWGYVLGDDGSGYNIGRSALTYALRDLESETVWHPDSLTESVVSALGVKSVMELTKTVYTTADPRSCVAGI